MENLGRPTRRARVRLVLAAVIALSSGLLALAPAVAAAGSWSVAAGAGDGAGVTTKTFYPGTITIDAGDTVTWVAQGNAHTVSFLAPAQPLPSPEDPANEAPAGGSTEDGSTFTSSGILVPAPGVSYSLSFPTAGTYQFHCLFHPGMDGTVVVNAAGTAYPKDAATVASEAGGAGAADVLKGEAELAGYAPSVTSNGDGTKTYHYAAGLGSGNISILSFIAADPNINVGDSIEWTNYDSGFEPHSISFGTEPQGPQAFGPAGGSNFEGGSDFVSSGLYFGAPGPGPHSYTLTFTKPGTYPYYCVLHDLVGMKGTIVVGSASTPPAPTLPPTDTAPVRPAPAGGAPMTGLLWLLAVAGVLGIGIARRIRRRQES
jgi:plastocyanin